MKHIVIALCTAVISFSMASAFAEGGRGLLKRLKGAYAFTTNESCAEVPVPSVNDPGFTPPPILQELEYPQIFSFGSNSYTVNLAGKMTFDGAGNAKSEGFGGYVLVKAGPLTQGFYTQPYGTFNNSCDWTYSVEPDNRFSMEGSCNVVQETGPAAPTNDVTGPFKVTGYISRGGSALLTLVYEPIEQTTIRYQEGNPVPVYIAKRLCATTSTYIRVHKLRRGERGDDDGEPSMKDNLDPRPWW